MRPSLASRFVPMLLCVGLMPCGCRDDGTPPAADATDAAAPSAAAPPAAPAPAPASAGDAAPAPAATAAAFDPASVAESAAALPPFPFFQPPAGLASVLDAKDRAVNFDREHMIAGNAVVALEGKAHRDRFQLEAPDQRRYSAVEFHRNYADAIRALGGVEVSLTQYTNSVNDAFGGREVVDRHYHGTCASEGCENHTWLIRQGGQEYWIQVSTGAIPLHGEVVVLQREGMRSSLALLSADAMKQAIDATGRVALQVNFDTDRATLRPDAQPTLDEIAKLLNADPALNLSIDGHTDTTGTPERNLVLSRERAQAVRAALLAKGIAADRLQAQGFGSDRPVANNATEDGRAKNRRVELVKLG